MTVGRRPNYLAIDDSINKIYVANHLSRTISIIDGKNDTKKSNDITVGALPTFIAIGGDVVYVGNTGSGTVSAINESSGKKTDISLGTRPSYIAIDDFNKIYVTSSDSNTVSVIDGNTDRPISANITVGTRPTHLAVNTDTNIAYIVNQGSNTV